MPRQSPEAVTAAYVMVFLIVVWSVVWKLIACWKAARRDQRGWFIAFILLPPLAGTLEIFYVFWIAPRVPDLCERGPW